MSLSPPSAKIVLASRTLPDGTCVNFSSKIPIDTPPHESTLRMQMTGYTKLFGCIVASTIWREPHETRIVWITMLALADKNGIVASSLPGLADLARVSIPECEVALLALQAPDAYSRTKDFEGRRVEPCDGGWFVLNHGKYRAKMGADERREYMRIKQQEHRDRKKAIPSKSRKQMSRNVKGRNGALAESTHAEAQSDADADAETNSETEAVPMALPREIDSESFRTAWAQYQSFRKRMKFKTLLPESIAAQLANLAKHGEAVAIVAINTGIANGWQGLFPEKVKINGKLPSAGLDKSKTIPLKFDEQPTIWRP